MNIVIKNLENQFRYYKSLGEKAIDQVSDNQLFHISNKGSNSIAIIVNHLSGNMLSRWTDFLTTDGEKKWRDRDSEFEISFNSRKDVLDIWDKGWDCLFATITELKDEDLNKIIYVRNQGHTVLEALNRQLAHYSYHVGQIVYISKVSVGEKWESLSIAPGKSKTYNHAKFKKSKALKHYTEEFLNKK